jgi:NADP-dependent 3-hydroxy acid dehydrogenase YdfG
MGLDGKICIITGGGSGIGRATGLKMAGEGGIVILVGRTASKVEGVKSEIEAIGGEATAFGVDVTDENGVKAMVNSVLSMYGKVDVLLNNAGHSSIHRKLLTTTAEEVRSVLESNLMGSIFCTQAVMPSMLEAREGTIINVSSLAGVTPGLLAGMAYGAAKAGVINFTQFLNSEFRNTGIRASVIIPGEVDTPILDKRPVNPSQDARETMVTAEDAAEAITLIARLPSRASIPELVIRPTYLRDTSAEVGTS